MLSSPARTAATTWVLIDLTYTRAYHSRLGLGSKRLAGAAGAWCGRSDRGSLARQGHRHRTTRRGRQRRPNGLSEEYGGALARRSAIEPVGQAGRTYTLPGPSVRAIYIAKAAAMSSLLVVFWTLNLLVFHAVPAARYSAILLLGLMPTLLVAIQAGEVPAWMLTVSFTVDVTVISLGIHFGGGVDNVSGPLLSVLTIGLAGLILSDRAAFACAAASAVLYGLIGWGEQTGRLPHYLPYAKPADDAVATVICVSAYLFVAAWIVSYTAHQVRATYQRIEDARREAVTALSHDLKNPLSAIDGYAEMGADAPAPAREDYLRRIRQAARRALDLVHNELDAVALEGRHMIAHGEPVRVNELVDEVVEIYRISAEAKGVRLTTALAADGPTLSADRQLLGRAIGNLVSNAIKYTAAHGLVEITTAAQSGCVTVRVQDTGCGIAPATQAQLFRKYSRVPTGTTVEGSGLGLHIVRRVAEAHGGSVSVVSALGQGSTFTLSLPGPSPG